MNKMKASYCGLLFSLTAIGVPSASLFANQEKELLFPDCLFSQKSSPISKEKHTDKISVAPCSPLESQEVDSSCQVALDSLDLPLNPSSPEIPSSFPYIAFASSQQANRESKELQLSSQQKHIFVEGSFLYWYAKQEGNEYAVTGAALTVPGTFDENTQLIAGSVKSGKLHGLDFSMNPGYKVGGGMYFPEKQWDLFVQYTHLFSHAEGSVKSNNLNAGIVPLFGYSPTNSILSNATYDNNSTAEGFVARANSSWSLEFNNINLELGRIWNPSSSLQIHPFLGLQGSWQTQRFNTTYKVNSLSDMQEGLGKNTVTFKQKFNGIGLRLGFDGTWKCLPHLDLFGNVITALLWGQFNCRGSSYDTNTLLDYSDVLIDKQVNRFQALSPLLGLELGLQSAWSFYGHSEFLMQLGWENQVWFFQNQHSSTLPDSSLILQGLTLTFRLIF